MQKKMKFMNFCAGIGGGRLGLEETNLECDGDLMQIDPKSIPDFDVMIGGFPCQSYSIVGQRKGLEDLRGQVIYGLIHILKSKNTPCFILENVKGLVNHDKGKSLEIILEELDTAGYQVDWKVLDSLNYGVPQMRERVYFVGIRKDLAQDGGLFKYPIEVKTPGLENFLIDTENKILEHYTDKTFQKYLNNKYNKDKFEIDELLQEDYLVLDTRQSDLRIYRGKVPTLRTSRHGILYVKGGQLKKLSGYEALLLQGFPKELAEKSRGQIVEGKLLSQAGNAMTVNVIAAIGKQLLEYININNKGDKGLQDIADNFNSWETD